MRSGVFKLKNERMFYLTYVCRPYLHREMSTETGRPAAPQKKCLSVRSLPRDLKCYTNLITLATLRTGNHIS